MERFYKTVDVASEKNAYTILLDGRQAKSRSGKLLSVPNTKLAAQIASEWEEQKVKIDFTTMPMTRFQMSVMDMNSSLQMQWIDEISAYLRSDLLCYRAEKPEALRLLQTKTWDPFLIFIEDRLGIKLVSTNGIVSVTQPDLSMENARKALETLDNEKLLCAHRLTELTGSAALAFAALAKWKDVNTLIRAAHIDEIWQSEQWGFDKEAEERLKAIALDIKDVFRFLSFCF